MQKVKLKLVKRILAFALMGAMVITSLPGKIAYAAETETENTQTVVDDLSGDLKIQEEAPAETGETDEDLKRLLSPDETKKNESPSWGKSPNAAENFSPGKNNSPSKNDSPEQVYSVSFKASQYTDKVLKTIKVRSGGSFELYDPEPITVAGNKIELNYWVLYGDPALEDPTSEPNAKYYPGDLYTGNNGEGVRNNLVFIGDWGADSAAEDAENAKKGVWVKFYDPLKVDNDGYHYEYTGNAVTPKFAVYDGTKKLVSGVDYTYKFANNVNAFKNPKNTKQLKATLTITGKGSYTGYTNRSKPETFIIDLANISVANIYGRKMTAQKNTAPAPVLIHNGKILKNKTDYTLELKETASSTTTMKKYKNEEGTAFLTVIGAGNYVGSQFSLDVDVKKSLPKLKVSVSVGVGSKKYQPKFLDDPDQIEKWLFEGNSEFKDKDGNVITTPALTVVNANKKDTTTVDPKKDTQYYVAIDKALFSKAGTVNFTIVGINEYTGTYKAKFTIKPMAIAKNNTDYKFVANYDGKGQTDNTPYEFNPSGVEVTGLEVLLKDKNEKIVAVLTKNVDYKVSYSGNKAVSTATKPAKFTITFINNYKGSTNKDVQNLTFRIKEKDLSKEAVQVIVPDMIFTKTGRAYKSTPIVTVNGVTLNKKYYTTTYDPADAKVNDGVSVPVTIDFKAGYAYTGGLKGTYTVKGVVADKVDLSKATVKFWQVQPDGSSYVYKDVTKKGLNYTGRDFVFEKTKTEGTLTVLDVNKVYVEVLPKVPRGQTATPVSEKCTINVADANAKGTATLVINGDGVDTFGSKTAKVKINPKK